MKLFTTLILVGSLLLLPGVNSLQTGGAETSPTAPAVTSEVVDMAAIKSELWRIDVSKAEEKIEHLKPGLTHEHVNTVARAFVAVTRDGIIDPSTGISGTSVDIRLPIAIAYVESKFNQQAIGSSGEKSLMQVLPIRGRPIDRITSDRRYAIFWALTNCFVPGYNRAKEQGKSEREAIRRGLICYNGSASYADKVLRVMDQL